MARLVRLLPLAASAALALPASAGAASVEVTGNTLRLDGTPDAGETFSAGPSTDGSGALSVSVQGGTPLEARAGCSTDGSTGATTCDPTGVTRILVYAGDGDDTVTISGALPARVYGGPGDDALNGGDGGDRLSGGTGSDTLHGNAGADSISGERGFDLLDGGTGNDRLYGRDGHAETVSCGAGADHAFIDVADQPSSACEQVDYGPLGQVGPLRHITGGGRFVAIPGQPGERVDRRLLPDVLYLIRRFHLRVTDAYSVSSIHAPHGEHPLGLAVDFVPGPGGSWDLVDRLARWAEPRQNHPRRPFRWVGYNGDPNHGRGNHLHLSWEHSPGTFGRPVKTVWVFDVRTGARTAKTGSGGGLGASRYTPPERGER